LGTVWALDHGYFARGVIVMDMHSTTEPRHPDQAAYDLLDSRRGDPAARPRAIVSALTLRIDPHAIASLADVEVAEVDHLATALGL
jgi:hypothetical protein